MLGLADRGRVLDLFDMILRASSRRAAGIVHNTPTVPIQWRSCDLAEIAHWVSVIKITPDAAEDPTVSPG
jgi:DNA polymerase-3 subunit gamma/tau